MEKRENVENLRRFEIGVINFIKNMTPILEFFEEKVYKELVFLYMVMEV